MSTPRQDSPPDPRVDAPDPNSSAEGTRRGRRWYVIRLVVMVVGLIMLAGAIVLISVQREALSGALQALADPRPGPIAILLGSMLVTILITGWQFQILLARHRLPTLEMMALISGSALLNFLPLKVGLLGRVTYHQAVHGIHPLETVRAMIFARGAGLLVIGLAAVSVFASEGLSSPLWAWLLMPVMVPGWFVMARATRTAAVVVILKYLDLLLMAVRLSCAFTLMEVQMTFATCVGLACIGMLANAIPFLTGGLGLREWLIGWFTSILVAIPTALALGVFADLINRAAELLVLLPVGGISILWLRPRFVQAITSARERRREVATDPPRSPDPEP